VKGGRAWRWRLPSKKSESIDFHFDRERHLRDFHCSFSSGGERRRGERAKTVLGGEKKSRRQVDWGLSEGARLRRRKEESSTILPKERRDRQHDGGGAFYAQIESSFCLLISGRRGGRKSATEREKKKKIVGAKKRSVLCRAKGNDEADTLSSASEETENSARRKETVLDGKEVPLGHQSE